MRPGQFSTEIDASTTRFKTEERAGFVVMAQASRSVYVRSLADCVENSA
jgi:hypothetical protein